MEQHQPSTCATNQHQPGAAPRLMDRVRGSLFVLTPGFSHALQLGWRLIVPFPEQLQPIVQPGQFAGAFHEREHGKRKKAKEGKQAQQNAGQSYPG